MSEFAENVHSLGRVLRRARVKEWRDFLMRFRWAAARAIAPRRAVYSRGLNFTLQCDNWVTHYRWSTYNTKEPETLDWIDTWVRDGEVLFDIGANIGIYSIYAALRHTKAWIIAFEPEYANLHLLRDNIIKNGLQDRVEVYSIGLSNRSGFSYLHIQDFTPGASLHTESKDLLRVTRYHRPVVWREGIYTFTLDGFCEETGLRPNHIKLDVDGTEPEVLEGALHTLRSPELRSLMIELPKDEKARESCVRRLIEWGFRREWRDPRGESQNEVWVRNSVRT